MSIDYAGIIRKANERKEALQRAAQLLERAPGELQTFWDNVSYFGALKTVLEALDTEGKSLLGPTEISSVCTYISSILMVSSKFTEGAYGSVAPHTALSKLVEKVK